MSKKERLGDAPIEEKHRRMMNTMAHALDGIFNDDKKGDDRKIGFVLMVFPFGDEEGRCNYISNAHRPDVVKLLEEQLARFKAQDNKNG